LARKIKIKWKVDGQAFESLLNTGKLFVGLPERYDVEVKMILVQLDTFPDLFWMKCPVKLVFYRGDKAKGASHLIYAPKSEIERVKEEAERWLDINTG